MIKSLESALLVTLREAIRWESSLAPKTASGTLTPILPDDPFDSTRYARRDRELAFRDVVNAAAIVQVVVEIGDVWNAAVERPIMQGPQRDVLPWNPQDARSVNGQVLHVKNVSVPVDALGTDRDLYGRDALIYETLARACAATFANPPIASTAGAAVPSVTAWSLASGTEVIRDISPALAMNRDLFKLPDQNLADRDNQSAARVAQLVQVLKNPFEFAERLYARVSNTDARETEVYVLTVDYFVAGTTYNPLDEVYYGAGYYRAKAVTSEVPTNATFWLAIDAPTKRTFAIEPRLLNRNKIIYDTAAKTLQWVPETNDFVHVPQLYAMSIPGIFGNQRIDTVAQVPERKDAQFWRQKASKVAFDGEQLTELATIANTASFSVSNSLIQLSGASFTIPVQGTFAFDAGSLPPGNYRVALLVRPDSVVEIAGAQNLDGVGGTLGGATYPLSDLRLSWPLGLSAAAQWTFQVDYTNLTGTTNGFRVEADLSGASVLETPLYFNDNDGNPLPNGQIVSSYPVAVVPTGAAQVLGLKWTGGNGDFHVRTLRFETPSFETSSYRMFGTLADSVATVDVVGGNKQTDLLLFDFTTNIGGAPSFVVNLDAAELPLRVLQAQLLSRGTFTPTPTAEGFEGFRNDCAERALRSIQDSFSASVTGHGTDTPSFCSTGNIWDTAATESWMGFIEVYEQRLRELPDVPSDQIVSGRQYRVSSGTILYFGTYVTDQTFYGTWTDESGTAYEVNGSGATVTQIGAFVCSRAGHVGKPALVPAGIERDTATGRVTANYTGSRAVPQLVSLQPWMVEAGFYTAAPEFWSPPVM